MMARLFILICVVLCCASAAAQNAVQARLAEQSLINDVALLPNNKLVAVGERGHILLSSDSGETWVQVATPTRVMLTGVFFIDAQRGWAVGHDAVILQTTNGGLDWKQVFSDAELEAPLMDVWFENPRHGLAVGAYGLALRTTNGGETWQPFYLSDEEDYHLNQIAVQGKEILIAAESGRIYLSDNSGLSWQAIDSPYEGSLFAVNRQGQYAVAAGLRGHVVWSVAPFKEWIEIESPVSSMLLEIASLSDTAFLLLGQGDTALRLDLTDPKRAQLKPVNIDVAGNTLRYIPIGKRALLAGSRGIKRLEAIR